MRDRLRPAVLARKVLLPPVLAGAAVTCLLAALALTIAAGPRAAAPNPLARAPVAGEELAIGLSLELGVSARLHTADEPPAERAPGGLTRVGAARREPATLALPVAGVVGGCGTFGCPRPGHLHNGVDLLAAAGTPVRAAASGRVALVQSPSRSSGYGNFVCLQHRPALATCYAHLSAVAARVRPGELVRRGQVVGLVGSTGSASTPHLHFEVRRGPAACQQSAVDPLAILPRAAGGPAPAQAAGDTATVATHAPPPPAVPTAPRAEAPAAPRGGAPAPQEEADPSASTVLVEVRPQRIRLPPDPVPAPQVAPSNPAPATDPTAPPAATIPAPPLPG